MKVAVVGAGISGIAAADRLQRDAEVTLFEAERRIGGHTDTHSILVDGRTYSVDSGFIVFNPDNYPNLVRWFEAAAVPTEPSDMPIAPPSPVPVAAGRLIAKSDGSAVMPRSLVWLSLLPPAMPIDDGKIRPVALPPPAPASARPPHWMPNWRT